MIFLHPDPPPQAVAAGVKHAICCSPYWVTIPLGHGYVARCFYPAEGHRRCHVVRP